MSITNCRYYLLIVVDDLGMVNMTKLGLKGLLGVWLISIPFTVMCQLPRYAIIKLNGWPEVHLSDMGVPVVFLSSFSVWLFSNIPDFISISIFIVMLKHFKQQQVERISPGFSDQQQEEDYGGIWVGQEELALPGAQQTAPDGISIITIESRNTPNVPNQVGTEVVHNNYIVQESQVENEDLHRVTEVVKSLKLYVLTSLLDMVMIFTSLAACLPHSQLFMQVEILIGCFWIPLYVIVNNFPQLRKLFGCCWNKVAITCR